MKETKLTGSRPEIALLYMHQTLRTDTKGPALQEYGDVLKEAGCHPAVEKYPPENALSDTI